MSNSLHNVRVALLEARMSSELAGLITRHGGVAYTVPAVREVEIESGEAVSAFIDKLERQEISVVVFMTGVGVTALFREAERLERLPVLIDILQRCRVVCRGPKPVAVLKRSGIPVTISAREPHTTTELIEALQTLDLNDAGVGLVHYGEKNVALTKALQEMGAHVEELCLYEWLLPEDTSGLKRLVEEIIEGKVAVVAFTSQVQARHLFLIAEELGRSDELRDVLNNRVVVASIGPTCTAGLQSLGVKPHVEPEHPKMGHMVMALVQYMQ